MGFRNGAYARVWEKGKNEVSNRIGGTRTRYWVRINISRKLPDGNFFQQFSGFCELKGDAVKGLAGIKIPENQGLVVKLGDVDLENSYNPETNETFWSPIIWSFEQVDAGGNHDSAKPTQPTYNSRQKPKAKAEPVAPQEEDDIDEDDLPF